MKISPFAPRALPDLPAIKGVQLAACEAGIRYQGRKDLALVMFDSDTTVAGTLTQSKTASAAVCWCRENLPKGCARALVVNSGNANAFTGKSGDQAVKSTAEFAAKVTGCRPDQVFLASTGVIGEALSTTAFLNHLEQLAAQAEVGAWLDAAEAIMTTDTYPKLASRQTQIDNRTVLINGIAKGSGMIAPDMATMLSFIFTDASFTPSVLQKICTRIVNESFNSITVDGDTSTSDTVLIFATGKSEAPLIDCVDDPRGSQFVSDLTRLSVDLAQQIVKDGEGASKFVTIRVEGAEHDRAAKSIALSIANSPLVKTAIAGEDPNWGRIVMAVGKAGEAADRDLLSIWFGDILVADKGEVAAEYEEQKTAAYMKKANIDIRVDVGIGKGAATVWTCDLTPDYISINADYRS